MAQRFSYCKMLARSGDRPEQLPELEECGGAESATCNFRCLRTGTSAVRIGGCSGWGAWIEFCAR